jgi:hypothetical protein
MEKIAALLFDALAHILLDITALVGAGYCPLNPRASDEK